jgi:hypothetical protein
MEFQDIPATLPQKIERVVWGVIYICVECHYALKIERGTRVHKENEFLCAICRTKSTECYRLSSYIVTEPYKGKIA